MQKALDETDLLGRVQRGGMAATRDERDGSARPAFAHGLGGLGGQQRGGLAAQAEHGQVELVPGGPQAVVVGVVLELQGHGGPVVMQMLLSRCLDLGARLAEPGEFSRRAFLNGKMDLAQAEAVADLIDVGIIIGSGVLIDVGVLILIDVLVEIDVDDEWRAKIDARVKAGGRMVYVTCSLLDEEGAGQVDRFLAANPGFAADPLALPLGEARGAGWRLHPALSGTDGFFIARLCRA